MHFFWLSLENTRPGCCTDTLMISRAQFEVSFECLAPISEDIEWKLIYVRAGVCLN